MTETIEHNATSPAAKRDMPALSPQSPKLMDQVRARLRVLHYSLRTERTYTHWIARYIRHHSMRHPRDMGATEVEAFLSHLATAREVAAGTQNQAMHAVLFLYKQVLGIDLPWLDGITHAKPSQRLPVVLTRDETQRLLAHTHGTAGLIVRLLYGSGMRLMEGLRLRIKDVDFSRHQITVRAGKGDKDRITLLPASIVADLQAHIAERRRWHDKDLALGMADVELPHALERKYPNAGREWGWQYVFAATGYSTDPRTGVIRRHHVHEKTIQRAVKEAGYDIRTVQELLGHSDVSTTMIYTHVLNRGGRGVVSPLDSVPG